MGDCGRCGAANRKGAQFCASCGATLLAPCPACGAVPGRPGARFCDTCGTELIAGRAGAGSARKVVTVLFADLVGSTAAQEHMDPESVRKWIDRFNAVLRREVDAEGGRVVKFTGDGVMAVFGIPEVREDDARRALAAAVAMHAAVAELGTGAEGAAQVALRVGVNTGEVVVDEANDDVVGDAVNVAARLEQAAGPGEVLAGETTFRLVRLGAQLRALPPLELKGKAEPVHAFLLVSLAPDEVIAPPSPFVGRAGELERLVGLLDSAIAERRTRLASIVGSPGVGKSRLARELAAAAAGRARVVDVRCDPAGGATFAPIAAALRVAASLEEDAGDETVVATLTVLFDEGEPDRARIASTAAALLGVGEPGPPEETFWAVRRLIESTARERPLLFVFDDVHWAEPLLLDLIENLVEWARDVPVLIVVTGRPELRDLRPSLVKVGRKVSAVLDLEGLPLDESRRLTRALPGGRALPDALLDRVAAASEGNPLFVGELVRMLVDDGVLRQDGGEWVATADLTDIEVPPSIHALLAARIDRLTVGERSVLEAASVIGKTFYRGALVALVEPEVHTRLDEHLAGLRHKELVDAVGTYWIDEPVLRFHHQLIRDAAYRRLLKEDRAALHERAARWLEAKVAGLVEYDEVVGYQLEQAHLLRAEIGSPLVELGREAADRLAAAGRRALEAEDLPVAASLLGRALACLAPDEPRRSELLLERCEALLAMGDVGASAPVVDELTALATGSTRLEGWAACFAGELANLRDPSHLAETADLVAAAATQLSALGDAAGEAKAHSVRAASLARLGRIGECERSLDLALAAARSAGDRRRATAILAGAPTAALWGPNPVTRASGRCLDVIRVLRITNRAPAVEATSLRCQAVLEALRGRETTARRMLTSARTALEELGHPHGLLDIDTAAGMVEGLAGDDVASERYLRRAHEGFRSLGIDADAGLAAALLARVHIGRGESDVALELTAESERLGGDDLKTGIAWRAARAEALAHRGELPEALRLARAAVALAEPTDALVDHADALLSLAEVLRLSDDPAGAAARAQEALELYERKEATVPAERARAFLDPMSPPGSSGPAAVGTDADAAHPPDNLAVGVVEAGMRALLADDWGGLEQMLAVDVRSEDRRSLVGGSTFIGRAAAIGSFRAVRDIGVRSVRLRAVATRGQHLCLVHATYGSDLVSVEALGLYEVDAAGRLTLNTTYDLDQLEEALADLDLRHADGAELPAEPVPDNLATRFCDHWVPELLRGEWDALRERFAQDVVGLDHRPLVGGDPIVGRDAVIASNRGVVDVGVTALRMVPLVVRGDRWALLRAEYRGSLGGLDVLQLVGVDADGRLLRSEVFELDQLEEATVRLDELAR